MMLWRKTVVAAIAGLSCCRRRKWWLRGTRCHCFNGEEKKTPGAGFELKDFHGWRQSYCPCFENLLLL
jgi:hypothetical protein